MTYRDRRLAKADRLRNWADSREAKADAAYAAEHAIGDGIPLGQPILVGHHSQRRAERDRDRMISLATTSLVNTRTAESYRSRADHIDAAAERAIYSDDPDAIEKLEAKIAGLEAKREQIKAANAAYRREHRAELKAMSAYERHQAVPFPSYVLQNLGGNLTRQKQRLARLKREAEHGPTDRIITARFASPCADCGADIERGQTIRYNRQDGARCLACGEEKR